MAAFDYLHNKSDLNRIGLAQQEQNQDRPRKNILQILNENSAQLEALLRSIPQLQGLLADVRKGVRTRWNGCDLIEFDTNSVPATNRAGFQLNVSKLTGGVPLDSLTVESVGGAGTTMRASINGSRYFRVDAGDVFDDGEIWDALFRVETGAAGMASLFVTWYQPGLGGQRGL